VLLLTDISVWGNIQMKMLMDTLGKFADGYDGSNLILSYNPMMTIALTAEILATMGKQRRRFQEPCSSLVESLLQLGRYYSDKIDDQEYYESLI